MLRFSSYLRSAPTSLSTALAWSVHPSLASIRLFSSSSPSFSSSSSSSSSSASEDKKFYLLEYEYVENAILKRKPYRNDHLALANEYVKKGTLLAGGAWNPATGATLLFRANDKNVVEEFARHDPYVVNGVATKWNIKEWTVVVSALPEQN